MLGPQSVDFLLIRCHQLEGVQFYLIVPSLLIQWNEINVIKYKTVRTRESIDHSCTCNLVLGTLLLERLKALMIS
jgi:hypothetical protein